MNQSISKSEIIETFANKFRLSELQSKQAVESILNSMIDTLVNDGNIEIRRFGTFHVRKREPRIARNPKTGEKINIDAQYHVHFKPGEPLRVKVNQYAGN
jgi:integration host factor subunit beta